MAFRNPFNLAVRSDADAGMLCARIMASTLDATGERREHLIVGAQKEAKTELDKAIARGDTTCAMKLTVLINTLERLLNQYDPKKKDNAAGVDSKILGLLEE